MSKECPVHSERQAGCAQCCAGEARYRHDLKWCLLLGVALLLACAQRWPLNLIQGIAAGALLIFKLYRVIRRDY